MISKTTYTNVTTNITAFLIVIFAWGMMTMTGRAETPPALPQKFEWNNWIQADSLQHIEDAFNTARIWEANTLTGEAPYTTITPMDLVNTFTLEAWNGTPIAEQALWLINDARTARGLPPYEGIDPVLNDVTADYAQFMFDSDTNGHRADNNAPYDRYLAHSDADSTCARYFQESIAYFGGSYLAAFPIPLAVYNWIYTGTPGHRASILFHGEQFVDDYGTTGAEGLIGIGLTSGTGYEAFNSIFANNAHIIVFNHLEPSENCYESAPETQQNNRPTPTPSQRSVEQSATINISNGQADVTYSLRVTANTNLSIFTEFVDARPTAYSCHTVATTSLPNGTTESNVQCNVTYPLTTNGCRPHPIHRVTLTTEAGDTVIDDLPIELSCETNSSVTPASQENIPLAVTLNNIHTTHINPFTQMVLGMLLLTALTLPLTRFS